MTRRTTNNAGITLRPGDGHSRQIIRDALAATRTERHAEARAAEAKRRVGVLVRCDEDCNVTDAALADARARAEAHLGGAAELLEPEGLWFPNMGGSTTLVFRLATS